MTEFIAVIPARYASERLPGKPLRQLAGMSMLEHVWRIAVKSGASEVLVATDDSRIYDAAQQIGALPVMTDPAHPSGSDRIAEIARLQDWSAQTIVVNVQCDEPLLPHSLIRQVATTLSVGGDIATLATPLDSEHDFADPNTVKVVLDRDGRALYFSRASIPYNRSNPAKPATVLRHIGLYAYRVQALQALCALPPCELEQIERLEQLRALWAGMEIRVGVAEESPGPGVDTEQDLQLVEKLIAGA